MDYKTIDVILREIATSHHTTVDDVRKEIRSVMEEAQQNQNPLVQARWAKIPHSGDNPSIEDLVTYIASVLH